MTDMSATLQYVLFGLAAASVLLPALLAVASRNLVHAGFWLLPTFLGVAAVFVLLGSGFLAAVQVLIYVGAIALLLLFVLMLTRGAGDPAVPQSNRRGVWAGLLAAGLAALAVVIVGVAPWDVAAKAAPADFTQALGQALLGPAVLPFEAASVLLLSAMVGAIVIARKERA